MGFSLSDEKTKKDSNMDKWTLNDIMLEVKNKKKSTKLTRELF